MSTYGFPADESKKAFQKFAVVEIVYELICCLLTTKVVSGCPRETGERYPIFTIQEVVERIFLLDRSESAGKLFVRNDSIKRIF